MKLYRIFTENVNYQNITERLDIHFPNGYTIINANGARQGQREKSLIIEIVINSPVAFYKPVEQFVYWLKKFNEQDAVLLEVIECESRLL
ncbi:hypothetical protein LCGC14_0948760 [marine sediment metagenome]|uniref:Uncharacterized protein n=1 Tax=marine sediment metagenome TaxID=412755 RepID=A0A0F9NHY2_9ZZZZ